MFARPALGTLAQGFLKFRRNQLRPTAATLLDLYAAAVIVLFRLIFLRYAEANHLLPATGRDKYLRFYSLESIWHRAVSGEVIADATRSTIWGRLRRLWTLLAEGYEDFRLPPYPGRLFAPTFIPFLEQVRLDDATLIRLFQELDPLFGPQANLPDLLIMNTWLASLLPVRLAFATAPLTLPASTQSIPAGTIYSEIDPAQPAYAPPPAAFLPALLAACLPPPEEQNIGTIQFCDPTLGAGRLLLAAADFLAQPSTTGESPPLSPSAHQERRAQIIRHHLFGLSTDPLALELARLTLHLAAADLFAPEISWHLQVGNPRLGLRWAELQAALGKAYPTTPRPEPAGQPSLWLAVETDQASLSDQLDITIDREVLRRLAHLWTCQYVDQPLPLATWRVLVKQAALGWLSMPELDRLLEEAETVAAAHAFFHWELDWGVDPAGFNPHLVSEPAHIQALLAGPAVPGRAADLRRLAKTLTTATNRFAATP